MRTRILLPLAVAAVLALPIGALAQDAAWTPSQLTALIGGDLPQALSGLHDVNSNDRYAVGIDVFGGTINLQAGQATVPVNVLVFRREASIGAVYVEQSADSAKATKDPAALYAAVRSDLLAGNVAADTAPAQSADGSSWTFPHAGWAGVRRGTADSGLSFYAYTTGMQASYQEFWRNYKP
jgi:hypothetical protein